MTADFPFAALVGPEGVSAGHDPGQLDDLRLALVLGAINPAIGGVLVRGEKGTAKSTAVRGLAALLPDIPVVDACPYNCASGDAWPACPAGPHSETAGQRPAGQISHPHVDGEGGGDGRVWRPVPLVELPVGASEDRLVGSLDLERALREGARAFEPGLLARAHRGVLYVDEVNLLGDHLVDVLLDAAAMGTNVVEREGVSVRHPSRFQLVGTMNPEEGELRPQLLDRFGLTVEISASRDRDVRAEVVRRRLAYEADPDGFAARWAEADARLADRLRAAQTLLADVDLDDRALRAVVAACAAFDVDGLRADIVTAKAAAALAAWHGRTRVSLDDVRRAALLALPHRRRRGPFDPPGIDEQALDDALASVDDDSDASDDPGDGDDPGGGAPGPDGPQGDGSDPPPPASGPAPETSGDGASPAVPPSWPGAGAPGAEGHAQEESAEADSSAGASEDSPAANGQSGTAHDEETTTLPVGGTFRPTVLRVEGIGQGAAGRRSRARGEHGHHVGARRPGRAHGALDIAATLRTAAARHAEAPATTRTPEVRSDDLRVKVREGREGNLVLFVVDASGSMAARQRMTAVKGAVLSLLLDAYQRRDRVGVITFRGAGAELALPATGSIEQGARLLTDLPTGGRTPLAAGLERAASVLASERVRDPDRRALLVLLTDGRATSGGDDPVDAAQRAAAALAATGVPTVVVDTEEGPVRLGLASRLAATLGTSPVTLDALAGDNLAGLVRGVTNHYRRDAR